MTELFSHKKWRNYLIYFTIFELFLDLFSPVFLISRQSDTNNKKKLEREGYCNWLRLLRFLGWIWIFCLEINTTSSRILKLTSFVEFWISHSPKKVYSVWMEESLKGHGGEKNDEVRIYTCISRHTRIRIYVCVEKYTHTHTHTHIYIYTYIYLVSQNKG